MAKYPKIWTLQSLGNRTSEMSRCVNGRWVRARAEGFPSFGNRVRCAWLVFTGKADAVIWPEDQENPNG